jgi:hypothetical protein
MAFLSPNGIFVLEKNEDTVNLELLSQTMIEVFKVLAAPTCQSQNDKL